MYQERFYRSQISSKYTLEVAFKESDLLISSSTSLDKHGTLEIIKKYYYEIETYIKKRPEFISSLSPLENDSAAPAIIRDMLENCQETGIGPFASVAGAIAMYVGSELLSFTDEVVVENGGDIFLKISRDAIVSVYLGERFSYYQKDPKEALGSVVLQTKRKQGPFGIASSSAYIGHSLNFGKADLVTLIAQDAIIADGFATALSNQIKHDKDIEGVIEKVKRVSSLYGILIAFEGKIYLWGDIALV